MKAARPMSVGAGAAGAGAGAAAPGGCGGRTLRLLLLAVLALAAVEYMFGSILETGSLRSYLYAPTPARPAHATQPPRTRNPNNLNIRKILYKHVLETGSLRSYLYVPKPTRTAHARQPTRTRAERFGYPWPKRTQSRPTSDGVDARDDYLLSNPSSSALPTADSIGNSSANSIGNSSANSIGNSSANSTANVNGRPAVRTESSPSRILVNKIRDSLKLNSSSDENEKGNETEARLKLKPCPASPPDLGPVSVDKRERRLAEVELQFPEVGEGGRYAPVSCRALHRVAIIVPFRDREQHLAIFLNHMHPLLMSQQLDYGIFIVEQQGERAFNRAKLMNVGYAESQRSRPGGWDCFVFHDIDLLPLDTRNLYSCPRQPRHMSQAIDKYNYKLPYADIFGGVSAMTVEHFEKVNGFSNKYWGWGGEDDDMFHRIKKTNYHVSRYPMSIARYTMLEHKSQSPNPKRYQLLSQTNKVFTKDGLSSLEYQVVSTTRHHLYTHILANIDEHS